MDNSIMAVNFSSLLIVTAFESLMTFCNSQSLEIAPFFPHTLLWDDVGCTILSLLTEIKSIVLCFAYYTYRYNPM